MTNTLVHLRFQESGSMMAYTSMLKAHGQLDKYRRQMFTKERRTLQKELRAQAPKKTGAFSRSIRAFTYETPDGMSHLEAHVDDRYTDLLGWIVNGTRAHEIPTGGAPAQMAKGYPLRFYWEHGPNGPGVYYYWRVWHPGTKPNNFPNRALRARLPYMRKAWRRIGVDVASVSVR
jgi:hypothetical protein